MRTTIWAIIMEGTVIYKIQSHHLNVRVNSVLGMPRRHIIWEMSTKLSGKQRKQLIFLKKLFHTTRRNTNHTRNGEKYCICWETLERQRTCLPKVQR